MTWTADSLAQRFPDIPWKEPLPVAWEPTSYLGSQTFACRICIANHGLNRRSSWQWGTEAEAAAHIRQH